MKYEKKQNLRNSKHRVKRKPIAKNPHMCGCVCACLGVFVSECRKACMVMHIDVGVCARACGCLSDSVCKCLEPAGLLICVWAYVNL